jgi:carboxyl-terminal processing protease
MSSAARRTVFSLVVFFTVCGLGGFLLSHRVGAQSNPGDNQTAFRKSLEQFSSVYQLVAKNYADPLTGKMPGNTIYDGAIPAMLRTLDPHSNFFDPKAFKAMQQDEGGQYYGVGMLIQMQFIHGQSRIVVAYPMPNSPALKAGIHPGDVITAIDGKSTAGMSTSDVANLLKGEKGTVVHVTIQRIAAPKPLVIAVTRDEIPNPSIDVAYDIRPGVAYIHIKQIQETTGKEFAQALKDVPHQNGLILDLRDNPGGVLVEAVSVCDHLLKRGQVIVSQRGRAYPDEIYRATHGNHGADFPIVDLVNHGTASAAEIITGALQDHDRALVAGRTTFGKGLVQTVYRLSYGTGLTLTTYHYFTPSGRLIQRNYKGVSLYDYYYVDQGDKNAKNRKVYLTDSGRTVYGGGGITPDVELTAVKYNDFQSLLYAHYMFQRFAEHYVVNHTINRDFEVNDTVLNAFEAFLKSKNIAYTPADINGVLPWLKAAIKSQVFVSAFGERSGQIVLDNWDPEVKAAIGLLPQAQALETRALKADAAKLAARADLSPTN